MHVIDAPITPKKERLNVLVSSTLTAPLARLGTGDASGGGGVRVTRLCAIQLIKINLNTHVDTFTQHRQKVYDGEYERPT